MEDKEKRFLIIFSFLFGIWFLDYLSTFFALVVFGGFKEANPTMAFFFETIGGISGWSQAFLFALSLIILLSAVIFFASEYCYKKTGKEGIRFYVAYIFVGIFFIKELVVIIPNVLGLIRAM